MFVPVASNLCRIVESDDESDSGEETTVIYQSSSTFASQVFTPTNIRDNSPSQLHKIAKAPIRRSQSAFIVPLTVVLDLDNTLICSSKEPSSSFDFNIAVPDGNGDIETVYVTKRPRLDGFLTKLCQISTPYLFSSGDKVYVDQVMSFIDPLGQIFSKVFYRESCKLATPGVYIKDLSVVGTYLPRTCLVDDQPESFGEQTENGVKITPFNGDPHDRELDTLLTILEKLRTFDDVRPILRRVNHK